MRSTTFVSLTILSCGLAFAAGPRTATYVGGNLDGWAPNTGATIDASGEKAIALRAGETKLDVPFNTIAKAELGEVTEHAAPAEPLYKVWSLHKRVLGKRQTQQVTLDFKAAGGEARNITLELEKDAAEEVIAAIEERTAPKTEAAKAAWWGDSVWKTNRNKGAWDGAPTVAGRE